MNKVWRFSKPNCQRCQWWVWRTELMSTLFLLGSERYKNEVIWITFFFSFIYRSGGPKMTSWSTTRSFIFADSADTRTPTSGARAWISPCLPGTTTWSSGWEQTLTGPRTTPTLTSWWTLLIGLWKLSQDCVIHDVFRRNGIVIIDECPGVALDHFEAGNVLTSYSLILSLYWQ